MTPKEKADKLCMMFLMHTNTKDREYDINKELAKQCALIAVDEMISEAARMKSSYMGRKRYEYLLEVKQEIEKL
jgi:hypothetical protein